MKPTVYLETTIISYLAARPSADLITAANQLITHDWWSNERSKFQLFVSEYVFEEAVVGDSEASGRRLSYMSAIDLLATTSELTSLALFLAQELPLPKRARLDAFHIAAAAIHGLGYLLTWNCKHIANETLLPRIQSLCLTKGYRAPILCTPDQLLKENR